MLLPLTHGRESPMSILLSINHVPIIRFPGYGEALTAMASYLAKGHPGESILLTSLHDGEPTDGARRPQRPSGVTPAKGSVHAGPTELTVR
jgi:hypothetical protein